METELNKNEKLSTEQENPPIANVLLGAVLCPECEGSGIVIGIQYTAGCCGYANEDGSCCNNPIPEPIQVQEQCHKCRTTGYDEQHCT